MKDGHPSAYAEWNLGWDGTDSFPLFQKLFHCKMEKQTKKKLLEIPCKFYNNLWAGKQHVILRSENKIFQFLTSPGRKITSSFFQGVSVVAQPWLLS